MKGEKVRSGPVYLETDRGTISLVFEREAQSPRSRKPDVYVIDGDGVRLIRHKNRLLRAVVLGVLLSFLLLAISRIARK